MKKLTIYQRLIKRILDIVLCSLALVVLSPIFLVTAIAIKLSSPGTVLYHSERAGIHKQSFRFYKFRSMHNVEQDTTRFIVNNNRVFLVGKIIRRLKIDELPQLINVIKGDMSIVGPRPMGSDSVDRIYCGRYEKVADVRPGLTSAASLYDYTIGETYTDDISYMKEVLPIKLEMERYYVEHVGFCYDVQLVFRTIITIFQVMVGMKHYLPVTELKKILH